MLRISATRPNASPPTTNATSSTPPNISQSRAAGLTPGRGRNGDVPRPLA
jgi:hypothetical protein